MLQIYKKENNIIIQSDGQIIGRVISENGAEDHFTELEPGVWEWIRRTAVPVTQMELQAELFYEPSYWMVPAVNYNGNGFGTAGDDFSYFEEDEEYIGMGIEGKPWKYGFDRCSIPAAVYSEGKSCCGMSRADEKNVTDKRSIDSANIGAALFADGTDRCSCSIWVENGHTFHTLYWPLTEGPKVLWRKWREEYRETMEPMQEFRAYLVLEQKENLRHGYSKMLDFAWRKLSVIPKCEWEPDALWESEISYAKRLWERCEDGFCGFNIGMNWKEELNDWGRQKAHKYEIGWCGQNASLANSLLTHYLRCGDREALEMGMAVLDSWAKYAWVDANSRPRVFRTNLDNIAGGTERDVAVDACNLGTAAMQFMEAAELIRKCGRVSREEMQMAEGDDLQKVIPKTSDKEQNRSEMYLTTALEICDFALARQEANGRFAKSWDFAGRVAQAEGTVGCFLVPPLVQAWKVTGEKRYLDAAEKAYAYYRQELEEKWYTTAGALDTFCIDKESSLPLLKTGLALYEATGKEDYLQAAEHAAWYLSTWQWHYDILFPKDTLLWELDYKTCGTTSVSTAHLHLDWFALNYAPSLRRLAELTGNSQWAERAEAIFNNATQLISDGTTTILGKTRPCGSQDEGILHTRWGWHGEYSVSEWLVAWPCAFRLENLRG